MRLTIERLGFYGQSLFLFYSDYGFRIRSAFFMFRMRFLFYILPPLQNLCRFAQQELKNNIFCMKKLKKNFSHELKELIGI